MHIAICDDNIADRKQSERLLSRESDKRIHTTGNLYVDSYGNVEALLKSPQRYDLFFIDMTDLPPHGIILHQLPQLRKCTGSCLFYRQTGESKGTLRFS